MGSSAQADATASARAARTELGDRERGDRGLLLGGTHLVAAAHGSDGVEIHRQRGVQRIVGLAVILDARDAEIRWIVACIEHDAGDRRLADRRDQLGCERRQLLRDQEWIAASAHVEHPLVVEVEAGLEAVVAAQDLHRQPSRHDLGDRGRDERLISILGQQLVALGVHHEHQPRRSEGRHLLLDAGQGGSGQQEQSEGEQARPHGNSGAGAASATCGPVTEKLKLKVSQIAEFPCSGVIPAAYVAPLGRLKWLASGHP